jgi:outer membrane protein TolC
MSNIQNVTCTLAKRQHVTKHRHFLFFLIVISQPLAAQIDLSLYGGDRMSDSIAQDNIESLLDAVSIEELLPPLSQLMDTAIAHSPEIREVESLIRAAEFRESEVRRDYWNSVLISGQLGYGNNLALATEQFQVLAQDPRALQQIGFGISIPLALVFNRSNRIGQVQADVSQIKATRDFRIRNLENELTQLYFRLLMLKRQLIIVGEAAQIGVAIKESMEMDFSKGTIDLQMASTGMNYWQSTNATYEQLRTDFAVTFLTLQRLVGLPFSRFLK